MSPQARPNAALIIGGSPRADLLPPEIKIGEKLRAQRRGLVAGLVVVVVVVLGGYAGVSALAQTRATALQSAQAETAAILQQQAKYAKANSANQSIVAAETARRAVMVTEIDWKSEIADVVKSLPAGSTLVSFQVTSSTPIAPLDSPLSPLEGERVAELALSVTTSDIPDTAHWIEDLSSLKGFVDATPSTIASDGGVLTTTLVLHLNDEVYWNRFATEAAK